MYHFPAAVSPFLEYFPDCVARFLYVVDGEETVVVFVLSVDDDEDGGGGCGVGVWEAEE